MQYKVSELSGALLDAAVAKAEGHGFRIYDEENSPIGRAVVIAWPEFHSEGDGEQFEPSSVWDAGGPIIQRERIELQNHAASDGWWAGVRQPIDQNKAGGTISTGPTPLVAAMRCHVKSRFGNVVDLP